MSRINKALLAVILLWTCVSASAQDAKPLTNQEFVKLLYQLPRSPEMRDEIVDQIRRRGIGARGSKGIARTKASRPAMN